MDKLSELIRKGNVLVVGECRGAKAEVVHYVSKKTGQKEAFTKVTFVVEPITGGVPILIDQRVADTEVDPAGVKPSAQKGKRYAFEIATLEVTLGMRRGRMMPGSEPVEV